MRLPSLWGWSLTPRGRSGVINEDHSLALEAYEKVRKAVFEDKENPALLDALMSYL